MCPKHKQQRTSVFIVQIHFRIDQRFVAAHEFAHDTVFLRAIACGVAN